MAELIPGGGGASLWLLASRVPHDCLSSPMLFNMYVKLLEKMFLRFGLECHQVTIST